MEPEQKGEPRELTEIEEWELERKLLELAYENSYVLLTGVIDFADLMSDTKRRGISSVLAHDPHEGPTYRELEGILKYFEDKEEYEKCHQLKQIKAIDLVDG